MNQPDDSGAYADLQTLISNRIGISFQQKDMPILKSKLQKSLTLLGLKTVGELYTRLARSLGPLPEELVSALTVGETYFFRGMEQLNAVKSHLIPELEDRIYRDINSTVWIAGCATGEEAYTLAMIFAQFMPAYRSDKLNIIATDLNKAYLEIAKNGIYTQYSMRAPIPTWARKYFIQRGSEYKISDTIRDSVKFFPHNLITDLSPAGGRTSLILCRNVLIYFNAAAQSAVLEKFIQALDAGGYLVLGSSESLLHRDDLCPHMSDGAIIYQKKINPGGSPARKDAPEKPIRFKRSRSFVPAVKVPLDVPLDKKNSEDCANKDCAAELKLVHSAINRGDPADAAALLDTLHRRFPMSVEAWLVHAQLHEQLGDDDAALEALRKARFIDSELIVAYYLSGAIEQRRNRTAEAGRHYAAALRLLEHIEDNQPVSWCDGLTKELLREHIETAVMKISLLSRGSRDE